MQWSARIQRVLMYVLLRPKKCNGVEDCADGSDEKPEECVSYSFFF